VAAAFSLASEWSMLIVASASSTNSAPFGGAAPAAHASLANGEGQMDVRTESDRTSLTGAALSAARYPLARLGTYVAPELSIPERAPANL